MKTYSDRKIHHIAIKACAVFPYIIGKQYNLRTIALRQYQMTLSSKGHSRLLLTTSLVTLDARITWKHFVISSKVLPEKRPL